MTKLSDYERATLRRWAQWQLGDSTWGDEAAEVVADPETANAWLDEEGAEPEAVSQDDEAVSYVDDETDPVTGAPPDPRDRWDTEAEYRGER